MSPEYVGALAETVGAVAVVVSLLYVAKQVRHNSEQARLTTIHSVTNQFHSIMQLTASSAESARVWNSGLLNGTASLREDEAMLFTQLLGLLMSSYEDLYYYHHEGLVGDERLKGIENPYLGVMACPGFDDYWAMFGQLMTEDFRQHVQTKISQARATMNLAVFDSPAGGQKTGDTSSSGTA